MWWGLGTLALDLVAVLVVTSLLRSRMPYGVWRRLHWLPYATWPLAFLHALGSGSDAGTWWLRGVALGCFVAVAAAAGYRLAGMDVEPLDGPARPGQPTGAGGSWDSGACFRCFSGVAAEARRVKAATASEEGEAAVVLACCSSR